MSESKWVIGVARGDLKGLNPPPPKKPRIAPKNV